MPTKNRVRAEAWAGRQEIASVTTAAVSWSDERHRLLDVLRISAKSRLNFSCRQLPRGWSLPVAVLYIYALIAFSGCNRARGCTHTLSMHLKWPPDSYNHLDGVGCRR